MKRCTRCLKRKPLTGFYRSHTSRDGRMACCRTCQIAQVTRSRLLPRGGAT